MKKPATIEAAMPQHCELGSGFHCAQRILLGLRAFVLMLLATLVCSAAVPQVTNIRQHAVTHASIRWTFKVNMKGAYVWIRYGTSPGQYPYNTGLYQDNDGGGVGSLSIGGLKPGTTYYFRINARPNANDMNDLCASDSCGSVEQVVTTLPEPEVHPQPPTPPNAYVPSHPDMAGYVTVRMKVADNGECVAAESVPSRNIVANDKIQRIIDQISYGTIVEFPQGITCLVPPQDVLGSGYTLREKPVDTAAAGNIDSPAHRWIIFRTESLGDADFTPWGSRTNPDWAPKMAKIVATTQTTNANRGQIFHTQNSIAAHHFWFENLEMTHVADPALSPADSVDPRPFRALMQMTGTYAGDRPPSYIVLDRLYIHGQGAPFRMVGAVQMAGRNLAMIGSYIDKVDYWRIFDWPHVQPSVSPDGTQITVPRATYQRNSHEPVSGMSRPASFRLLSGASTSGAWVAYLTQSGLTIRYSTGLNIQCTDCTTEEKPSTEISGPDNSYIFCWGNVQNGRFSVSNVRSEEWTTSQWAQASVGVELMDNGTGPYLFSNNYVEAYYMGFYIDAGATNKSNDDLLWVRNHMVWNQNHRSTSPTSDGFRYNARQLWEVKRGKRFLLSGNLFQGNWSHTNVGPSIFLSGRSTYVLDNTVTGVTDYEITNNVIRHASYGWSCMGASNPPPDPQVTARVLFANNLLYDINRYVYDESGPSFASGYMDLLPGCEDVQVRNNTMGLALGRGPYLMLIGGGHTLGEGLAFTDNIMYMSFGEAGGLIGVDENQYLPITRRQPTVPSQGTVKQKLDAFFTRNGDTPTPNYSFTNNIFIGGKTGTSTANLRDLTQSEIDNYAAGFPPGNFFPRGASVVSREQQVFDMAFTDYRLNQASTFVRGAVNSATTGRSVGVDHDSLESAMGVVKRISVVPSAASARFSYLAPDGNGCSVDLSKDGQNWSRFFDSGGARDRILEAQGLEANMTYLYRILCYYEQVNDGERYTEYKPDQITRGQITTGNSTGTSTVPLRIGLTPPARNNASRVALAWSATPAVSSSWQESPLTRCGAKCSLSVASPADSPLFFRWTWYDDVGNQVGKSSILPARGR